jgi:tripartite-type tricarboxylate transporter receptor subunit TctC
MGRALARVHVPFRGGAETIQALLGGQINVSAESSARHAREFHEEDSAMVRAMGLRF